jgi:4-amino-4-deoxy-L-arabinose transferase-like glycosyltransferase
MATVMTVPIEARSTGSVAVKSRTALYLALFLTAFALRFGFVLVKHTYVSNPGSILPFGAEICSIAERLAEGRGYSSPFYIETGPTAWVAPVYPAMVSAVFRLFGIFSQTSALVLILIQCLMAAATSISIYALGRRCFGEKLGLWAAWIWAVSPIFFRWPVSLIWDFTLTALLVSVLLILTLDAAEKGTWQAWLLLGGTWSLMALTNPAPLTIMPFSFAYAAYCNHKAAAMWVRNAMVAAALFMVVVSPWLIRNYVVFGHPVFFRSNYWFEFHLGNFHLSNGMGYSGKHPNNNPRIMKQYVQMGEYRFIENAKNEAFQFVRQYPREFISLTLHRSFWFWDGTPLRYQTVEWWEPWKFWPLSAAGWLGLIFVLTRRPRGWLLFAALLLVYPLPYYFAYPNAKYRHAVEPELLLLGVYAASVLWQEVAGRRASSRIAS